MFPKYHKKIKNGLFTFVQHLSKQLEVDIQLSDIRDVSLLPSKRDSKTSNISIEFSNTLLKSNFLMSAKLFNSKNAGNKINSTHLSLAVPPTPVHIHR